MKARLLLAATLAAGTMPAGADDGHSYAPMLPAYPQECAACHIAYPPRLLPAASWQRLMRNLPQHFGSDASLDGPTVQQISVWLQANAGQGRRVAEPPPEDRITRGSWFQHKHDEVPPEVWKRPAVRSAACRGGAAQGDFYERRVRIPK
jgi:hypothetical protein